jgi:outer membrane receptor protein involved in Fe transport
MNNRRWAILPVVWLISGFALQANAEAERRQIEEVIVTAEKVEATVSDTSLSITAIGSEMLEDMGIQSANEFINYIPATTRDTFDIRIRGVGRNFRALGGDPGVATYYNGVYSEDALVALTENALFDIERIEVLRGPQGTLYGRNAIGGAINYVLKKPSAEPYAMVRGQFGSKNAREYYGVLSGPITDELGIRVVASKRQSDPRLKSVVGGTGADSTDDSNTAISFNWKPIETLNIDARFNDRNSARDIGANVLIDEGWGSFRGSRMTDVYAQGLRLVDASTPGAELFTNPYTGETAYGAVNRPGVDLAPSAPNPAFGSIDYLNSPGDLDSVKHELLNSGYHFEGFDQRGTQITVNWDASDSLAVKYIFGHSDFSYDWDFDYDNSNSDVLDQGSDGFEAIYSYSHELQFLWDVNENLFVTAGAYYFKSSRNQELTLHSRASQGRIQNAASYGQLAGFFPALGIITEDPTVGGPLTMQSAPLNRLLLGTWQGDTFGDNNSYKHDNTNKTEQTAVFAQGVYQLNDEWAITLGVRWAEDEKSVSEIRGGLYEANEVWWGLFDAPFFQIAPGVTAGQFLRSPALTGIPALGIPAAAFAGFTDLAWTNFYMGNGLPTGNPLQPLAPVCPLDAIECANPLQLAGIPLAFATYAEDENSWDDVNFRVNLDWTPTDETLIYGYVTTGYRSGGYGLGILDARAGGPGGTPISILSYDEETVTAYELGYKGTLFDGTLQLFSAIYTYQYENYQDQIDQYDPIQGQSVDIPVNTGDTSNSGFEIEGTWLATDSLTINGNYSYTKTEYKDDVFLLEDENALAPEPLFGGTAFNVNGNALKGIPEHKFTAWANYEWILPDDSTLALLGAYSYIGEYNTDSIERNYDKVPERHRVDLSLNWRSADSKSRIRLFVDNLTDETNFRLLSQANHDSNYRLTGALLGERTVGVDLIREFGN